MYHTIWSRSERLQWITALFIGCAWLYASRNLMSICAVPIATELHWTRQDLGLVMGVFFWGYMVTQFLGGYLSDNFGGERVIFTTTFGWALLTAAFIWLPLVSEQTDVVFHFFLISRFLLGAFQGFFYPSLASLMAKRVLSSQRQFTYAFLTSGSHVGTLICGSLGSFLTTAYGWRVPFFLIGGMACLWSLLVYRILISGKPSRYFVMTRFSNPVVRMRPTEHIETDTLIGTDLALSTSLLDAKWDPSHSAHSMEVEKLASNSDICLEIGGIVPLYVHSACQKWDSSSPYFELAQKMTIALKDKPCDTHLDSNYFNWRLLIRFPAFWAMLLANFVHNNTFYIILNWLPSYFHDNFPDARSWVFNVVPWIIVVPCSLLSGLLADHLISKGTSVTTVRKGLTTVVLLGSSTFLFILPSLDSYASSLVCMSLAIACCGFHNSGVLLNPQDLAPQYGGQLYGIMSTVGTIPGFTGVYLTGYILQRTQQWSMVFYLTTIANLIGWLGYYLYGSAEPIL